MILNRPKIEIQEDCTRDTGGAVDKDEDHFCFMNGISQNSLGICSFYYIILCMYYNLTSHISLTRDCFVLFVRDVVFHLNFSHL